MFSNTTELVLLGEDDRYPVCIYCGQVTSDQPDEECLKCTDCPSLVHFACLADSVHIEDYSLLGDVFYKFTCKSCSPSAEELVTKEKISWLTALVLTLYNLQEQIYLSRHGYFHWKLHISDFIDRKWNSIFGHHVRRKRTWRGTVSGTLSHYSPAFFQTGSDVLRESGWWKLTHSNLSPYKIVQLRLDPSIQMQIGRKNAPKDVSGEEHMCEDSSDQMQRSNSASALDNLSVTSDRDCNSPRSAVDLEMLTYSDSEGLDVEIDMEIGIDPEEKPFETTGFPRMDSEFSELIDQYVTSEEIIPFSGNELSYSVEVKTETGSDAGTDADDASGSDDESTVAPPPKSLLVSGPKRSWPWAHKLETPLEDDKEQYIAMTEYEELQLFGSLAEHMEKQQADIPGTVQRLYCKLRVRQEQRHRRLCTFNVTLASLCGLDAGNPNMGQISIRTLDRYQVVGWAEVNRYSNSMQQPFVLRLLGHVEPTCFVSPYTERLLKPYIRRDYQSKPLWIRLMSEVRAKANLNNPTWRQIQHHPIDYSYVRPQHIPAINALCELFFWPGIDLTESLHYPDFSCVALYRKLVIGFAFMVPDVSYNESYISFLFTRPEWRRSGIATFMLYHLIQTCMGKDITLHVSATNPAIILYQRFGFKVEELAQDFYDKYLPANSKECKHALFLRLSR